MICWWLIQSRLANAFWGIGVQRIRHLTMPIYSSYLAHPYASLQLDRGRNKKKRKVGAKPVKKPMNCNEEDTPSFSEEVAPALRKIPGSC